MRQRYSYNYTLVPYKNTFLHNTSNLEQLVILGSDTEIKEHVPRIWGFLYAPHAQFSQNSRTANNGRDVGLLHAMDVRFAGYFYSIHCCLWCRQPLKVKIHGAPWSELKNKKAIVVRAAVDVDSKLYWRQSYVVLHTMFLALFVLQLANNKKATMDKIYYYVHKATLAIDKNADDLNNTSLFPPPEEDDGENGYDYPDSSTEESDYDEDVGPGDDLDDSDGCSDTYSDDNSEDGTLIRKILYALKRRCYVIESDFSILAWFCCVIPEASKDVANRNSGIHRNAAKRDITKRFLYDMDANVGQVISDFYAKDKHFRR